MKRTELRTERIGQFWAVFGAPLVGVPLMVAVLALGSGRAVDAAVEPEAGFPMEQVEAPPQIQVAVPEGLSTH